MPRVKMTNVKRIPPVNLDEDNPDQMRVWELYQEKTLQGIGAKWIREILLASVADKFVEPETPVEPRKVDRSGFVYLMKSSDGLYRIGKTKYPKMRLKAYKNKYPDLVLEIEHLIRCDDYDKAELTLHSQFEARRVGPKEWFRLTNEDVIQIKSISHLGKT